MVGSTEIQISGRIGVLMGGCSSEREISIKSGRAVVEGLRTAGCDVIGIELETTDPEKIKDLLDEKNIALVFIALHGAFGEDGKIQKILEDLGMPFTGSDQNSSALAMDKVATQRLLHENNISVPPFVVFEKESDVSLERISAELAGYPLIVKPSMEGSSIGISVVKEFSQLEGAVQEALKFGPEVLVEKFIGGKELTAGVLDGEALPVVEIVPREGFFDFKAKYQKGLTEYIVPALIEKEIAQQVQIKALKAYHLLGCRDMSRVDYILDDDQQPFILEINTIPGFTETSLLPMAARKAGYSFSQLCLKIAQSAWKRKIVKSATS